MEKSFNDLIWIIRYDLNYESKENKVMEIDRNKLERLRKENKRYYFKRVTIDKANDEWNGIQRRDAKNAYDKAIMSKYNVSSNYRDNRWFMEQVRPSIY